PGLRIGKAHGAARSGCAERSRAAKEQSRAGLEEAERVAHLALHTLVVKTVGGGNRRRHESLQGVLTKSQFTAASREDAVGARDGPGGANTSTCRHFEVARVNALLVVSQRRPGVDSERAVYVRA